MWGLNFRILVSAEGARQGLGGDRAEVWRHLGPQGISLLGGFLAEFAQICGREGGGF